MPASSPPASDNHYRPVTVDAVVPRRIPHLPPKQTRASRCRLHRSRPPRIPRTFRKAAIVVGELQSFAIPSYGGPYVGIIAAREKYIRQLPGRLVCETLNFAGHPAFCLTLATREQHIRREKATQHQAKI